ncbi:PAC2 family protein, partial [Halobium palmae]
GLVVESDPQFPDPEAARVVITDGIGPLTGVDVPTDDLVEHAEEIRDAKERLAARMREADEESTQARPLGMYQ